jgi:hypothetical protein
MGRARSVINQHRPYPVAPIRRYGIVPMWDHRAARHSPRPSPGRTGAAAQSRGVHWGRFCLLRQRGGSRCYASRPEQKPGAGRRLFGAAHVASEMVHRLVIGRIRGMPECLGRKLPGLVKPPRTFCAYCAPIGAVAPLDCDDLVIGTGWVDRNYMSPRLSHGGGLYAGTARDRACQNLKAHLDLHSDVRQQRSLGCSS